MGEVINMLFGKGYSGKVKEPLPTDSLYPFTHSLPFPGVSGIDLDDVLDGANQLRPERRIVGDEGNSQTGKHG